MNKEQFIKLLNNAKEDENGNLYILDGTQKIYFGTITTICDDLIENFCNKENDDYILHDRHFLNDDTLECKIVHN
jgi:hypothetical protein